MPTYEYICSKCEHKFETVQPITARPLTVCPKALCPKKPWGKGKVKRAIGTGGGLIFKGSGFYTTDYRSEKYKAAAKKDSGAISGSSSEGAKKEGKAPASSGSTATGRSSLRPARVSNRPVEKRLTTDRGQPPFYFMVKAIFSCLIASDTWWRGLPANPVTAC